MSIKVIVGDITKLNVDCVVNAANRSLLGGGGVDGAIHRASGPKLRKECETLNGCETGEAKMTGGYNMPCKYICHTVGPVYSGSERDAELLSDCYRNSLNLALAYDCNSIAFPCISCGVYGYPLDEACDIAYSTVRSWLESHDDMEVIFCCFDDDSADAYVRVMKR